MARRRASCASSRPLARCWRLGGEAHLQLGIATGGEPEPWPDAADAGGGPGQGGGGAGALRGAWHHLDGEYGWQSLYLRAAGTRWRPRAG